MTENAMLRRSFTFMPPALSGRQVEGTSFLPFGRYVMPDGSEQVSFGLPQPMLDAVRAVGFAGGREQDPEAPQGYVSENALLRGGQGLAESAMVGSLAARAPAGALRSGMASGELDPSPAARLARAREMGFDTDATWYHGTRSEFDAFSRIDGGNAYGDGFYFTNDPEVASRYAVGDNVNRITLPGNAEPNVIPVHLRASKPFDYKRTLNEEELSSIEKALLADEKLGENWTSGELSKWFDKAYPPTGNNVAYTIGGGVAQDDFTRVLRAAGYDALDTDMGRVVFDPRNIRSVNAMFDPAKSDSANLLAAHPMAGAVPIMFDDPEQRRPNRMLY